MKNEHELRCSRQANVPYEQAKAALTKDAPSVFQVPTTAAVLQEEELGATLKVTVGHHQFERDVRVDITAIDLSGRPPSAMALPGVSVAFTWTAAAEASLFPSMRAELTMYPLSPDETAVDFHGWYTPPGGVLGQAIDALAGHRLAEAAVHRFLDDVVERLQADARRC